MGSITSAMSKMGSGEVLAIQYVLQSADDSWRLAGRNFISKMRAAKEPRKVVNVDDKFLEGIENKISNPGYFAKIRIVSIAEDKISAEAQIQNLASSFEQFTDVSYNRFVRKNTSSSMRFVENFIYRRMGLKRLTLPIVGKQIYSNVSVLNIVEMATIFHFPNKDVNTPNIEWLGAKTSSAPVNLPDEGDGAFLG